MNSLSSILTTIQSKEEFIEKFSSDLNLEQGWLSTLILTFGYNNASALATLMGENVRQLYMHELKRLLCLQQVFFDCLLKDTPVTLKILSDHGIYAHLSVYEGIPQELIDLDRKNFLLADPTPQQTAKLLGLYHIPWIKELVDTRQGRLIEALKKLVTNQFYPDEEEEPLFYDLGALIWSDHTVSYAEMYVGWAKVREIEIKTSSLFYKLLLEGKELKPLVDTYQSFPLHKIQSTFYTFFSHEDSCLPEMKLMGPVTKDLIRIFNHSEQARLEAFCYIKKLHDLFNKETKAFNFDLALIFLNRLELNEQEPLFHFLHTCLHYFRLISILSDHKGLRIFLFYALYATPDTVLKTYNISLEDPSQQIFGVDKERCRFLKDHFTNPQDWGVIFYEYIFKKKRAFEYNLKDHMEILRIAEGTILGKKLPTKIVTNFLLHLPAKKNMPFVLKKFEEVKRGQANYHPKDLLRELKEAINSNEKPIQQLTLILYYAIQPGITTLFSNQNKEGLSYLDPFEFHERLSHLNVILIDHTTENYNFYHTELHAANVCEKIYHDGNGEKKELFKAIHALPLEERKAFDNRIVEKQVSRLKVRYEQLEEVFSGREDITLKERAEVYLQIAQTQSKGIFESCRSYLTVPDLKSLFQKMETILGMPLPPEIVIDLIFFRLTKEEKIFGIVQKFKEIQELVKQGKPPILSKIRGLKEEAFLKEFEDPAVVFDIETPRQSRYRKNVLVLADLLEMACCPHFFLETLSIEKNDTAFEPFHPNLPLGLFKMTFWMASGSSDICNYVTLLKKGDTSCFFILPFRMPQKEQERTVHFEFLKEAIKGSQDHGNTIFEPFAKNLKDYLTKGFFYFFDQNEILFPTLQQKEEGMKVKSRFFEGIVKKGVITKDAYTLLYTSQSDQSKQVEFGLQSTKNKDLVQITLTSISGKSLAWDYPHFKTEKDWDQALLYQATFLFLLVIEMEPIKFIESIEALIMMKLPDKIAQELLTLQVDNEKRLNILNDFKTIQLAIKTNPQKAFVHAKDLQELKSRLVDELDIPSRDTLAELIEWACSPASSLISTTIYDKHQFFRLFHKSLPDGPLKLIRWNSNFSMILKKDKTSCLFTIPFDVPSHSTKVLNKRVQEFASQNEANDSYSNFVQELVDKLTTGFYYLFDQSTIPLTTIRQTPEGMICHFKGKELRVEREYHAKTLKTLKKQTQTFKFQFLIHSQDEKQLSQEFYVNWHKESSKCYITVSLFQDEHSDKNSLMLIHTGLKEEEEWVDAVLYQAMLLYLQLEGD